MNLKRSLLVFVAVLALYGTSHALTFTTNMADIYAAGGQDALVTDPDFSIISSVADPFGGTISFTSSVIVDPANAVGGWNPWLPSPSGPVLFTGFDNNSVRLDFSNSPTAFGVWAMPNLLTGGPYDVTVALEDGSFLMQSVDGHQGPSLFGFTDAVGVDWLTISTDDGGLNYGLGFGDMVMSVGGQPPVIPEPATWTLLGLGLVGVGARLRKCSK